MKNPRTVMHSIVATLIAALATIALAPTATAADLAIAPESVVASFEGGRIRLADGWGDAHACLSDDDGTRCYRTKGEMNRVEELDTQPLVLLVGCGGPLYLYTGSSYTGNTLALSTRGVTISLSPYGFSNVTSSYQIGPCSARFYDTTSGGTVYPGNTNASVSSPSMLAGWDNRVSSVYIT